MRVNDEQVGRARISDVPALAKPHTTPRSRSQSRSGVNRAQRCRTPRPFHKVLVERGAAGEAFWTKFILNILSKIDRLLERYDDWETFAAGEEVYDENWENPRSLSRQLVHLRNWYDDATGSSVAAAENGDAVGIEAAAAAANPPSSSFWTGHDNPGPRPHDDDDDDEPTADERRLAAMEAELCQVKARYDQIPKSYLACLQPRKKASQAYRRLQNAKAASVEAVERVKASKGRLQDVQAALNIPKDSLRRAGSNGDGSFEATFAELDLNRRTVKQRRNEAYKTWAELVETHRSADVPGRGPRTPTALAVTAVGRGDQCLSHVARLLQTADQEVQLAARKTDNPSQSRAGVEQRERGVVRGRHTDEAHVSIESMTRRLLEPEEGFVGSGAHVEVQTGVIQRLEGAIEEDLDHLGRRSCLAPEGLVGPKTNMKLQRDGRLVVVIVIIVVDGGAVAVVFV
ncbi:uncharacterized protein LY79DRAFT_662987 [Colletotrichum navitas]|uniref:Uncharacterized protein n=1 Tax=Colletotrichum navitas TaxID=681940 RepID=A0AAD8PNT8_9PEZI|nr:uncharacterized protein LY79DRAFT_662987 [Colletotrichum navitas]KAK1573066.1 hypothetical protein LY79DRAFT_662987 [Colletotrichum navitas]